MDETDALAGIHRTHFSVPVRTITSRQRVAPEVVLLTDQGLVVAQPVARVTLEGHRGADG